MTVLFRQVYVYDADTPDARTGPVDVLVEGDRISAIGAHLVAPGARVVEGNNRHLLVPGLINAHFHSPANHLKGAVRSLPLELFMLYESPADPALTPTPREAYLRTMLGAIEMLQRGITTVQDDAFLMPYPDPQIIDAVASAYRDSGITGLSRARSARADRGRKAAVHRRTRRYHRLPPSRAGGRRKSA